MSERQIADLRAIRDFVQDRVAATSLRQVAAGLGMSPSGLSKFLDGAISNGRTLRALRTYYFASLGAELPPDGAGEAQALLRRLAAHLPVERRMEGCEAMARALAALHTEAETALPGWLAALVGEAGHAAPAAAGAEAGR